MEREPEERELERPIEELARPMELPTEDRPPPEDRLPPEDRPR